MKKRDELLEVFLVAFGANFQSRGLEVALCIACDPDTPGEILEQLARCDNERLLERIAEHPNTNPFTLEILAANPSPDIRSAVADNFNVPTEILEQLSEDSHPDVRYHIAENPCVSQDLLTRLAEDSNPYVAHRAMQTLRKTEPREGLLKNILHVLGSRFVAHRAV